MIVDSSLYETFSSRDPFVPQVPREKIPVRRVDQIKPLEPQVEVAPPPAPVFEPPPILEEIRPPVVMEPLPGMSVSGVVWNTDRPQAIINGQIVGIGDIVSGAKIVDIRKMGITFSFQGRTETLEFKR